MKLQYTFILLFLACSNPIPEIFEPRLKVVAYNVEHAKNTTPEAISYLFQSEHVDIICFNEVPGQGWTKKVGNLLGLPYSYEGKIASANHTIDYKDSTDNYYGKYKSILSKYSLKDTSEILLEGIGWSPASAVSANVIIDHESIQIFSLHIPDGEANPSTSKAEHLARIITEFYDMNKIILAGDFNNLLDSEPLIYLYDIGFYNSWDVININLEEQTTYIDSNIVIDHILFKGLELENAGIIEELEEPQSDHKPIWSIIKL